MLTTVILCYFMIPCVMECRHNLLSVTEFCKMSRRSRKATRKNLEVKNFLKFLYHYRY